MLEHTFPYFRLYFLSETEMVCGSVFISVSSAAEKYVFSTRCSPCRISTSTLHGDELQVTCDLTPSGLMMVSTARTASGTSDRPVSIGITRMSGAARPPSRTAGQAQFAPIPKKNPYHFGI